MNRVGSAPSFASMGAAEERVARLEQAVRMQKISFLEEQVMQMKTTLQMGGDPSTMQGRVTLPPLAPPASLLPAWGGYGGQQPGATFGQLPNSPSQLRPGQNGQSYADLMQTVAKQCQLLDQHQNRIHQLEQQAAAAQTNVIVNVGSHPLAVEPEEQESQGSEMPAEIQPFEQKWAKSAAVPKPIGAPRDLKAAQWPPGDPSRWEFKELNGYEVGLASSNEVDPIEVETKEQAIQMVKSEPNRFFGCMWVQAGYSGPAKVYPRGCTFYKSGFYANENQPDATGAMMATYHMLPEQVSIDPDAYTDSVLTQYQGRTMTSKSPGRGQGVLDKPGLKIILDINPRDVDQGGVGDCWLLSAISALAEFDSAIAKLFKRRRESLHQPPKDTFNKYTITLYDLGTWKPVDVVVDERLIWDEQRGDLLGAKASGQGDLWPLIIEKAVAAHCGGWDKIDGGQCTHAWRILTGCKEVYTIQSDGSRFRSYGAFNPNEKRWEQLANSPHDGFKGLWPMNWPEVGGGGGMDDSFSEDQLFTKMATWDLSNFIMGAGTKSGSDTAMTDGIVDGHAYTVLSCLKNAGGSGIDMVKMRNPWGSQEFQKGGWVDGGPNWQRYPKVYEACGKPVPRDDGVFWIQKETFFKYFPTLYLCAMDMAAFATKPKSAQHGVKKKPKKPPITSGGVPTSGGMPEDPPPPEDKSKWEFDARDGWQINLTRRNKVHPIEVDTKEDAIAMVKSNPKAFFGCMWIGEGFVGKAKVFPRNCTFYKDGFAENTYQPDATGAMKATYQMLPKEVTIIPDEYTDHVLHRYKHKRMSSKCPGRGQGIFDQPGLKIVEDVCPGDIRQGGVGDCWLLSAISAMAEFDDAITVLFKKRRDLHMPPKDTFNLYTIQLYDLTTWKPVDVVIDERLIFDDHSHDLLSCKAGKNGDLWPNYIEKAVAALCGGWDKIDGGQCTHAWRMLIGCRDVYTITHDGDKYSCTGAYNPNEDRWEQLANSPHDGFQGLWPMKWPETGGGGALGTKIGEEEMFTKMCAWDDENYIMCAGTRSGSDTQSTNGIVDGHAYTILTCIQDAGGTGFDMVKVRNPWGQQEFECGGWTDGGPNWKQYPRVYEACNRPVKKNDGIFWMQKENFFAYFSTIYLCAHDMAQFSA